MVSSGQIKGKLKFFSKPYGRQWKWRYQLHGHMHNPKVVRPEGLDPSVKIIDPLDPKTIEKPPQTKWVPPRRHPLLEPFFPQLTIKDHPKYNEKPIKLFDKTIKAHNGIDQICLLTKTKAVPNLPASILSLVGNFKLENQDELVQNYIRQALAFNPTKIECKGFKVPNDPKINVATEFATPHHMQMRILLDNFIRLSNIAISKKNLSNAFNRQVVENVGVQVIFPRADDIIQIRRNADFMILNKNILKPVASEQEIAETKDHKLINMYPIYPTIDLKEENIYDLNETVSFGLKQFPETSFIETIFQINDDGSKNNYETSRLIMFAFGNAYAQSQLLKERNKLELDENGLLKKPIVVKAVSITNEKLNFVVFQLNTLNLNDNNGVKNLVFYDNTDELYSDRPTKDKIPYASHKNIQRMALSHLKYNPSAFEKLLAINAYGVN